MAHEQASDLKALFRTFVNVLREALWTLPTLSDEFLPLSKNYVPPLSRVVSQITRVARRQNESPIIRMCGNETRHAKNLPKPEDAK